MALVRAQLGVLWRCEGDEVFRAIGPAVPSLGLTSGWQCLELGAGAGSIACWLAARVGPSGQVVATDIDPRFLQDLKLPNLEVRRHDIRTDALEREAYDLVHCRNLLVHLPDPEQMARRMVAALRPGG
jgi:2-polyprenyl-3-methyl-5-hydroxy-6-metoxy-1,4-benzoquinol methylase